MRNIAKGKTTDVFKRGPAKNVAEELCFSLELRQRTLDLQCESEDRRDEWVAALTGAVERAKKDAHERWLQKQRERSAKQRQSIAGKPLGKLGDD